MASTSQTMAERGARAPNESRGTVTPTGAQARPHVTQLAQLGAGLNASPRVQGLQRMQTLLNEPAGRSQAPLQRAVTTHDSKAPRTSGDERALRKQVADTIASKDLDNLERTIDQLNTSIRNRHADPNGINEGHRYRIKLEEGLLQELKDAKKEAPYVEEVARRKKDFQKKRKEMKEKKKEEGKKKETYNTFVDLSGSGSGNASDDSEVLSELEGGNASDDSEVLSELEKGTPERSSSSGVPSSSSVDTVQSEGPSRWCTIL